MTENIHRIRIGVLAALTVAAAVWIGHGLYQIQVVRADELRAIATAQHDKKITVEGPRGAILDREGRELAVSVETDSLYVHPHHLSDEERKFLQRELPSILELPSKYIRQQLNSDSSFAWLRRRIDPKMATRVRALALPPLQGESEPRPLAFDGTAALGFEREAKRFYPKGSLGVHVVGFSNIDQVGVEGLEMIYQETLHATPTTFLSQRDPLNRPFRQLLERAGQDAEDLILTIDATLQHFAEQELLRGLRKTGAHSGSVVLMDPSTGEILALANAPTANPNKYGTASASQRRNRAVCDVFEPGSTFKIVSAAALLDLGRVRPEEAIDCEKGAILVAGTVIRDHHAYSTLSFRQVLEKSSNIGILKAMRRVKDEEFYSYIRAFGFGEKTGLGLPGESKGILHAPNTWSRLSKSSLSFGHELAVTPVQMVSAFATIANGGERIAPHLVLGKRTSEGKFLPQPEADRRRVIRTDTARRLTDLLEGVVVRGTASEARLEGYSLAGKTGTAQKAIRGGYSQTEYYASFGGFAPLYSPKLAGIVVLDTPRGPRHQGGSAAAPIFQRIFERSLDYLRVPPDRPLRVAQGNPSRELQTLTAHKRSTENNPLAALPQRPVSPSGTTPDVRGFALRDALNILVERGCKVEVRGSGQVTGQNPSPGTALQIGQTCSLQLATPEVSR